ncbi:MAG TPA: hypothetical protein VGG16_12920 [Streptosporangiaceae bacterium]|jgi:hypothetical protein
MLTFAADFWPVFWAILGAGAALTVLITLAVAGTWTRETKPDATLIQLAAAYRVNERDRERANAA